MKGNIIPPQHQKLRLKYGSKYPIRYSPLCLYHKQKNLDDPLNPPNLCVILFYSLSKNKNLER